MAIDDARKVLVPRCSISKVQEQTIYKENKKLNKELKKQTIGLTESELVKMIKERIKGLLNKRNISAVALNMIKNMAFGWNLYQFKHTKTLQS